MDFVNIMVKQDENGEYHPRRVPVLHTAGPWVVTPSATPGWRGFAVTYAPTGATAWPQRAGTTPLPDAKAMADKLFGVWSGTGDIPAAVCERLAEVVWTP
jgi:hypothetical protein